MYEKTSSIILPSQPTQTESRQEASASPSFVDRLPQSAKRAIGIIGSMIAGTLYGLNFVPVEYTMEYTEGASQNGNFKLETKSILAILSNK